MTSSSSKTGKKANTKPMKVLERRVYRGPNIHGYEPMIRIKIDLGTLEEYPSNLIPNFTDQLLQLMPTLEEHTCSYGERGGFVRRLREGTWMGHIVEHVALELQNLAGTPVSYGKTRGAGEPVGVYNIMYSYRDERVGLLAGYLALRTVNSLLPRHLQGVQDIELLIPEKERLPFNPKSSVNFEAELEVLCDVSARYALGPTTRSIVEEARRRGIPTIRLDDYSLVQLGYGKYQQRIRSSVTSRTSNLAVEAAGDKDLTRQLLQQVNLPVPEGRVVYTDDEAVEAAEDMGYPVVTKPLDGNHGRGVNLGLDTPEKVRWGFKEAFEHSRHVVIEQQFKGKDYRVLIIDGKLVAAAERVPAHVVGNGRDTIKQLIKQVNKDPRRGEGHEKVMTRITVDNHVNALLERLGYTVDSVPGKGEVVYLRETANMSTGGTAIDVTDDMHPDNRRICECAARTLGLDIAGIDLVVPDIRHSILQTGGGIVEVNAGPGFRMHLEPSVGQPRNIAAPVLDMLFPSGVPCRMPVAAITGTNGKTTTSRMFSRILKYAGHIVGLTTTTGIYVDGNLVVAGDTTGPKSARAVLMDPTVDFAVLETARGGILREGLAFEECDIGAVLNVQEDHLGLKGIDTIEDLAWVKSLVVEVVAKHGHSVLNADDPLVLGMKEKAGGKIIFFTMNPEHEAVQQHLQSGGTAIICEPHIQPGIETASQAQNGSEWIVIHRGKHITPLMPVHEIPATMEGLARMNIENAMAAVGMAVAAGIPTETIRNALATFQTSYEQSPGRLNFHHGHPFTVMMDYAHNPAGLTHLRNLITGLKKNHHRVIGVLSASGDRRDQDILKMGRLAGEMFDELILKDDDLRGRKAGDAQRLLEQGAREAGMQRSCIHHITPESEAVATALRMAQAGDLVVVLATEIHDVWNQIRSFDSEKWARLMGKDTSAVQNS